MKAKDTEDPGLKILREWTEAERGRLTALANRLDVVPSALLNWWRIPAERCLDIEAFTGISRHDMRPDVYGPPPKRRRKK